MMSIQIEKKRSKLAGAAGFLIGAALGVVFYPITGPFFWSIRAVQRSFQKSEDGFMPFRVVKAFGAGLIGFVYGAVVGVVGGIVSPFYWAYKGWDKGIGASFVDEENYIKGMISGKGDDFFTPPPIAIIDTQSNRTGSVVPPAMHVPEGLVERREDTERLKEPVSAQIDNFQRKAHVSGMKEAVVEEQKAVGEKPTIRDFIINIKPIFTTGPLQKWPALTHTRMS